MKFLCLNTSPWFGHFEMKTVNILLNVIDGMDIVILF